MERKLLERVVRTNLRYNMFARGHRIGVAVSGGADSVCLLELLIELAPAWNLRLEVLHLNHLLRGAESDADEQFVRELAARHELPFHSERIDIGEASQAGNMEEVARGERLRFFLRIKQQASLDRIATGHTRDDQAETVLFRILRGTGSPGLCGILPVTAEGLIRPLLDLERGEIEQWLRRRGVSWREDSTNNDQSLARNRIRHATLPLLEREFNPRIRSALARLAAASLDEESYWSDVVDRAWEPLALADGSVELDASALASAPPALARRLIRRAIERSKGSLQGVGFEHVEDILDLARRPAGHGRVDLPGASVRRSFHRLRFAAGPPTSIPPDWVLSIPGPGEWPLPSGGVIHIRADNDCQSLYNEDRHWIEAGKVSFPLTLRNWRPGDTFQPHGGGRSVKVKELFQRARVPVWERRDWPVILWEGQVAWIRRFGTAGWAAPSQGARLLLEIVELKEGTANIGPE